MERKIGEIFEFGGEWYQCVKSDGTCNGCVGKFQSYSLCNEFDECVGKIFKKLEKVGEPFYSKFFGKFYQMYKTYIPAVGSNFKIRVTPVEYVGRNEIFIEVKQNKEDMKEKKLNLKPFDLQKAREGKPVCTRDGRKARIICFDRIDAKPILALVPSTDGKGEDVFDYFVSGKRIANSLESDLDLMMLPEKKEGWVNVYKERIYSTKEEAIEATYDGVTYVDTVKICWEE